METSGSNTPTRKRRRKRLGLYILNDEYNSYQYVMEILSSHLPLCNSLQAEQIALITDNIGECKIYSGFAPEIYQLYALLQKAGLNVQIREYKKSKLK